MKNPKLITKPFAQNGQKNAIPENYSSSMESNQATWDQGFGQITMIPVAAGGLPPKGQDFNGIFNQLSENIVYLSKGGKFKFSSDYAAAIEGYPKGAILQSDDETKEYQSIIDNNKVNFNTATQAQINAAWKLFSTDDMLQQLAGKQPAGDYATKNDLNNGLAGKQPAGDYATNAALNNGLGLKLDKTGGTVSGQLTVTRSGDAIHIKPSTSGGNSYFQIDEFDGKRAAFIGFGGNSEDKTFTIRNDKDGTNLRINSGNAYVNGVRALVAGDYGLGSTAVSIPDGTDLLEFFKTAPTGFYRTGGNVTNKPHPSVGYADYLCIKHATQLKVICYSNTNITYEIYYDGAKWIGWGTNYSATNTVVDRNGCIKALGAVEYSDYLVGSPIPWPQSTAPTGYLICNGQSFNKTMWPLLAIAYPSGQLPDLRGEFIRGLDAGRNIDSGRGVLSTQGDAIRNMTGEVHGVAIDGNGVFGNRTLVYTSATPNGSGKDMYKVTFDPSKTVPTANENRPRNIAFLYIVRAA